jgi:hypothetical protein
MMLLNDGAAPAVVLVLLGLWFGQQGGLTQMQAESLSPDYSAAGRFQLFGASVMIPRPVDGQAPILASGAVPDYR